MNWHCILPNYYVFAVAAYAISIRSLRYAQTVQSVYQSLWFENINILLPFASPMITSNSRFCHYFPKDKEVFENAPQKLQTSLYHFFDCDRYRQHFWTYRRIGNLPLVCVTLCRQVNSNQMQNKSCCNAQNITV